MLAFQAIQTTFVPMREANIDTDQIIPARFLQKPRRDGCGPWLFHDLRENPAFVLNQPVYRDARALVAAENFGCGSSRENAVWALFDYGFRVVIAPSFGDIFYNNCLQNGLLPIALELSIVPGQKLKVDLGIANRRRPAFRHRPLCQALLAQRNRRTGLHAVTAERDRGV